MYLIIVPCWCKVKIAIATWIAIEWSYVNITWRFSCNSNTWGYEVKIASICWWHSEAAQGSSTMDERTANRFGWISKWDFNVVNRWMRSFSVFFERCLAQGSIVHIKVWRKCGWILVNKLDEKRCSSLSGRWVTTVLNEILPTSLDESENVAACGDWIDAKCSVCRRSDRVTLWMKCFQINLDRILKCCCMWWLDGWEACEVAQGRYLDDDSMKFRVNMVPRWMISGSVSVTE